VKKQKNTISYNVIFIAVCGGIFFFLLKAPPGTTSYLPMDDNHRDFMFMGKKEAEKFCIECHTPGGVAPLPEEHPPPYRCLFCHKRDQGGTK